MYLCSIKHKKSSETYKTVGKEIAPAASALLYNIVGRGQTFNNLRKYSQEIFKYLKLK